MSVIMRFRDRTLKNKPPQHTSQLTLTLTTLNLSLIKLNLFFLVWVDLITTSEIH